MAEKKTIDDLIPLYRDFEGSFVILMCGIAGAFGGARSRPKTGRRLQLLEPGGEGQLQARDREGRREVAADLPESTA